jgi:signal transduction histidine kinase
LGREVDPELWLLETLKAGNTFAVLSDPFNSLDFRRQGRKFSKGSNPMSPTTSQVFLQRFARIGSDLVILVGGAALVGWTFDIRELKSFEPGMAPMDPLSACLFVLSGVALRRLAPKPPRSRRKFADGIALICAVLLVCGAVAKLVEYLFQIDLHLDMLFFRHAPGTVRSLSNDDIAPSTALNLLFCGTGLVLFDVETRRGFRPAQALILFAGFVSLLALVGYAYRVMPLYSFGSPVPMALNSAFAFAVFCLSALAARPDRGVMRVMTSDTIGGTMARRLLPAAILIPLILGALRFITEERGLFEVEFGFSVFAVATMIFFTVLIWWNASLLYRAERERNESERRLAIQYGATRVLAESPGIADATLKILEVICDKLDYPLGILWSLDESAHAMRCVQVWYARPELKPLADQMLRRVAAVGTGLPGRIWTTGHPVWIEDVSRAGEAAEAQRDAAQSGLGSALGFPLRFDLNIYGVMEFYTHQPEPEDRSLLEMFAAVGTQTGQFIQRKHAEEQLKRAGSELARSNAELQQFAYVASHDLSEPLRMIVSYLELLIQHSGEKLDAEAREFIGYAVDGARRMRELINDLLAYARVDSRGRSFEIVDCTAALHVALANLKVIIQETQTTVIQRPLPRVKADSIQLTQVFQNLISNAIKFRDDRPPRIEIDARRSDREWTFRIQDNGIGIDPRQLDRIFVLFQRLHTRLEYPGTGMGLAICKKIIEHHGGRIWAESKPGQGSTFLFTLPALDRAE